MPSTSPVGSIQPHRRDGYVGELADDAHGVVLVLQLVAREDRHVLRPTGATRATYSPCAAPVLGPVDVEDERLRRHAVGVDAAVQRDDRVGPLRQDGRQPLGQPSGQRARIAARRCIFRSGRWRLRHVSLPGVACDLDLTREGQHRWNVF